MPAEWEPHESTWLAWPHLRGDWPGKFEPIPWVYAEIVRNLARHERVDLIVKSERAEKSARAVLERADALSDNVCFHRWRTDRVWTRDSGCIFLTQNPEPQGLKPPTNDDASDTASEAAEKVVPDQTVSPQRLKPDSERSSYRSAEALRHPKSGPRLSFSAACEAVPFPKPTREGRSKAKHDKPLMGLHFQFNAWAKYENYKLDARLGSRMAKAAGAGIVHPTSGDERVVLEGGSIDVNGRGTLLTTEECLLSTTQQRNPSMDRAAYEQMFADYFGVQSVIWLGEGIEGDDTHGHVDDLSRFVAPNTVVTMVEANAQDENYSALQHNVGRLRAARDQDGHRLNVVEIPMPRPVVFEGRRLPASYANFFIANGVVLVPVFNDPNDRVALNTLAELFPTREVVPIYSCDLIWGFGALHCMTQQQPAVSRP